MLVAMSINATKCETDFDFKTGDSTRFDQISKIATDEKYSSLSEEDYKIAMQKEAEKLFAELSKQ